MTDIPSSNFMSSRYPIKVIRSDRRVKTVSARIVEGVIRVRIPSWMTSRDEAEFVSDIVDRIERQRRSHGIDLANRARVLAEKFDLPLPASIRWSKTQTPALGVVLHSQWPHPHFRPACRRTALGVGSCDRA